MEHIVAYLKKEKYFSLVYLSVFLLSFHYAFVLYINSSFLGTFFTERTVGILFALGAMVNITLLLNISNILRRFGNWRTMVFFLSAEMAALAGLAFSHSAVSAAIFFIIFEGIASLLLFNLDIFLETEIKTPLHIGGMRGIYLTMSNFAFVLSPYLVGQILGTNNYAGVYFGSFLFVAVVFAIIVTQFKKFADPHYPVMHTRLALAHFIANADLFHIYITNFLLQFFYAVMVIYTPFYLHETLGFSWGAIGGIFTVMLLPFVMIQVPGGELADRQGEKKLLLFGLFLMAASTSLLPFLPASVVLWSIVLFATRCGAALVEIMAEAYFFKHVKGKDSNIIGFFRTTGPVAYIAAPLLGGLFLLVFPLQYIFLPLGALLFCGMKYALKIKDTN